MRLLVNRKVSENLASIYKAKHTKESDSLQGCGNYNPWILTPFLMYLAPLYQLRTSCSSYAMSMTCQVAVYFNNVISERLSCARQPQHYVRCITV